MNNVEEVIDEAIVKVCKEVKDEVGNSQYVDTKRMIGAAELVKALAELVTARALLGDIQNDQLIEF